MEILIGDNLNMCCMFDKKAIKKECKIQTLI